MKTNLIRLSAIAAVALTLTSCATRSEDIDGTYVSSSKYGGKSCRRLENEFVEVKNAVLKISKKQDKKADNDAVMTTIGAVLFWPSLFFIKGDNANAETLAELKGEHDAIKRAAKKRGCSFIKKV